MDNMFILTTLQMAIKITIARAAMVDWSVERLALEIEIHLQ